MKKTEEFIHLFLLVGPGINPDIELRLKSSEV